MRGIGEVLCLHFTWKDMKTEVKYRGHGMWVSGCPQASNSHLLSHLFSPKTPHAQSGLGRANHCGCSHSSEADP